MAKVLLAWEAGAYWGHRALVTAAAAALAEGGHELVVVAPEGAGPDDTARRLGLRWETMPALPPPLPPPAVPWMSRATTLWQAGFGTPQVLASRGRAWADCFARERPDRVMLQAAPFAQLAAHVAGLGGVEFGIGFDVPPAQSPFPAFRRAEAFDRTEALALERRMMATVAGVAGDAWRERPLHAAVSGPVRLVTSIPELDHYEGCDDPTREFIGPLPPPHHGPATVAWQRGAPRVLVYVRAALLQLDALLHALAALRGDSIVVCPDAAPAQAALARRLGLRLHTEPLPLQPLLPDADLVVCHGGGLMGEAVMHGRVCVAMPSHYEQFLAAMALKRHRLGVVLNPGEPGAYEAALRFALGAEVLRRGAMAFGHSKPRLSEATAAALRNSISDTGSG